MDDILKWLVSQARWHNACGLESMAVDFLRAVDEIKRLRAIVEPLEALREPEGASVTIFSGPRSGITVVDDWTYWKPIPFVENSLAEVLANALKARDAARKGQEKE